MPPLAQLDNDQRNDHCEPQTHADKHRGYHGRDALVDGRRLGWQNVGARSGVGATPMAKPLNERERGAELNRIMRGETQPGSWQSWWPPLAFLALGLVVWALIAGLAWLIWRAI